MHRCMNEKQVEGVREISKSMESGDWFAWDGVP